jgi:hypothetical protein
MKKKKAIPAIVVFIEICRNSIDHGFMVCVAHELQPEQFKYPVLFYLTGRKLGYWHSGRKDQFLISRRSLSFPE